MSRRLPTWTCQRQTGGVKCGAQNPNRFQLCQTCGKRRPPRKRAAHLSALDLPYEYFVRVNGGEHCGVCGAKPTPGRKLDRDHSHEGVGTPRGVLCWRHNKGLEMFGDDTALLRAAIAYLERSRDAA